MRGPCSRGSWGGSSMPPSVKRCDPTGRAAGAAMRARRLVLSGGIGSHNTRRAGQLRRACAGVAILDWRREVREMDCYNPGVPAAWPHVPSGGGQACREAQLGGIRSLRPRYACRAPARAGDVRLRVPACAGARVYLAPLFWHANQEGWTLSVRLQRVLGWWVRYLAAVPMRVVPLVPQPRQRVLIYTDATGKGALAWVAETPWGRYYAAAEVPAGLRKWAVRRRTQVAAASVRLRPWGAACGSAWARRWPRGSLWQPWQASDSSWTGALRWRQWSLSIVKSPWARCCGVHPDRKTGMI